MTAGSCVPGPDPMPGDLVFSVGQTQCFLEVRTRAGDIAEVPLLGLPDMILAGEQPISLGDMRFRVLSLAAWNAEELAMRWELRGMVFEGVTRAPLPLSTSYREHEPDGYADGRPYWF